MKKRIDMIRSFAPAAAHGVGVVLLKDACSFCHALLISART